MDIAQELYNHLPSDCKQDIDSGDAKLIFKGGNIIIVDTCEVELFNVLPLLLTKFGFCIVITYRGKAHYTHFAEILCRTKGVAYFINNHKHDYRRKNLKIISWEDYKNNKGSSKTAVVEAPF